MTQDTEDVVARLRNASQLAQKKYVTNSSELFDLAADRLQSLSDRIDVLAEALERLASMWDHEPNEVRDVARAALHQEATATGSGR